MRGGSKIVITDPGALRKLHRMHASAHLADISTKAKSCTKSVNSHNVSAMALRYLVTTWRSSAVIRSNLFSMNTGRCWSSMIISDLTSAAWRSSSGERYVSICSSRHVIPMIWIACSWSECITVHVTGKLDCTRSIGMRTRASQVEKLPKAKGARSTMDVWRPCCSLRTALFSSVAMRWAKKLSAREGSPMIASLGAMEPQQGVQRHSSEDYKWIWAIQMWVLPWTPWFWTRRFTTHTTQLNFKPQNLKGSVCKTSQETCFNKLKVFYENYLEDLFSNKPSGTINAVYLPPELLQTTCQSTKHCLSQLLPNIFILLLMKNIPLTTLTSIVLCSGKRALERNASTFILWTLGRMFLKGIFLSNRDPGWSWYLLKSWTGHMCITSNENM